MIMYACIHVQYAYMYLCMCGSRRLPKASGGAPHLVSEGFGGGGESQVAVSLFVFVVFEAFFLVVVFRLGCEDLLRGSDYCFREWFALKQQFRG